MCNCLDGLALEAALYIGLHLLSHGWPPVVPSHRYLHFPDPRMTCGRGVVIGSKYFLADLFRLRNHQRLLVHPDSFVCLVDGKTFLPLFCQGLRFLLLLSHLLVQFCERRGSYKDFFWQSHHFFIVSLPIIMIRSS